jgi:hypothetical protein
MFPNENLDTLTRGGVSTTGQNPVDSFAYCCQRFARASKDCILRGWFYYKGFQVLQKL